MPASDWNAVPPGSIWASAEGQCVWVPTTADTLPSRKCANAIFSLDRLGVEIDEDRRQP